METKLLICPECHGKLRSVDSGLACRKCGKKFKIKDSLPVFIRNYSTSEDLASESYKQKIEKSNSKFLKGLKKLHSILGPPNTSLNIEDRKLEPFLEKKSLVLNIGSSSKKKFSNTLNLDIGPYQGVDIVADGKNLPFKDEAFDGVIVQMVLEHVDEPEKVIKESYRVLKKKGEVYLSIPFLFAFHGSPDDFNRYTLHGLKKRLELNGFKVSDFGVISGPSCTLSQVLRYYFATLLSFNSDFLFSLWLNVFGWLTFPIKYVDLLLNKHKKAHMIAATIYAIGQK